MVKMQSANEGFSALAHLIAECPHSCALLVGVFAICPHFTLREKSSVDSFKGFVKTVCNDRARNQRANGAGDERMLTLIGGC